MKYKLVALDLDGTLLDNNHSISPYTGRVLKELDRRGIKVVIATGRSYSSLKPKIHEFKLEHPVICYNGAMIRDGKTDEILFNSTLNEEISGRLIKIARREKIHFHGFCKGDFLHEFKSESSEYYESLSGLKGVITDFNKLDSYNFTKGMFIAENYLLQKIEKEVRELYDGHIYMAFSKPIFLEVMDIEASKARALNRIIKEYGIERSEVIAFGDGLNDKEMLEFAGKGIVMCNGHEDLKKRFENSRYNNDEDGVARYIEGILG